LVKRAVLEYFASLTKQIGAAMELRNDTVAASPAVMAALGALGHTLSNIAEDGQRSEEMLRILRSLEGVDWARGRRWDGIAGKMRPDGVFSTAGGAKDSGHTCYSALVDSSSPHFQAIRSGAPAAA
jgi:DNA sulfur modification protein DndB